jgi:hypothetical protein
MEMDGMVPDCMLNFPMVQQVIYFLLLLSVLLLSILLSLTHSVSLCLRF